MQAVFAAHPGLVIGAAANSAVFAAGLSVLRKGLSGQGIAHVWLLGSVVVGVFGAGSYALMCLYFITGTLVSVQHQQRLQPQLMGSYAIAVSTTGLCHWDAAGLLHMDSCNSWQRCFCLAATCIERFQPQAASAVVVPVAAAYLIQTATYMQKMQLNCMALAACR
jgi:hypothetical protein